MATLTFIIDNTNQHKGDEESAQAEVIELRDLFIRVIKMHNNQELINFSLIQKGSAPISDSITLEDVYAFFAIHDGDELISDTLHNYKAETITD